MLTDAYNDDAREKVWKEIKKQRNLRKRESEIKFLHNFQFLNFIY